MIYFELPFLPPSVNAAYVNIPKRRVGKKMIGGGKRLTEDGKLFKQDVKAIILKTNAANTSQLKDNAALGIYMFFGFPNMLNKGYPDSADTKYKKIDLTNRIKLLEDAIVETIGIDDSQFVYSIGAKYESKEKETKVWLWNEDTEHTAAWLNQYFAQLAGPIKQV
jgi:Holliday junction resolvase RusA-like endonuclease